MGEVVSASADPRSGSAVNGGIHAPSSSNAELQTIEQQEQQCQPQQELHHRTSSNDEDQLGALIQRQASLEHQMCQSLVASETQQGAQLAIQHCLDEHVQSLSDTVEKISQSQVNILQDTAALTKTVHDIQTAIEPLLKPVAVHRSPNRSASWPNKMPGAPLGTAAGGGTAAVRWAASADAFGNQAT